MSKHRTLWHRTIAPSVCALACCLAALLIGLPAHGAETPPRDLHLVGDHWTAWNPPTDYPAGAQVYVIERGDTLWNLAGQFYGDPYLWPQLWERNEYILDSHWIYPGDPLLVDIEVATVTDEVTDVGEGPRGRPGDGRERLGTDPGVDALRGLITADAGLGPPIPLGTESDIYCSGFIGDLEEPFSHQLIGSEYGALMPNLNGVAAPSGGSSIYGDKETVRFNLSNGDVVYLNGGRGSGLYPGQFLSIVDARQEVYDPYEEDVLLGRFYRYLGRVRVLSVQEETAIGEILYACDPVNLGAWLTPFEAQPVPIGRQEPMRPINLPVRDEVLDTAGMILMSNDNLFSLGQGNLVYIDRGALDDLIPGDVFTIYRRNKEGLPPVVMGELAVLSVEDETALGRITESRYVVYVGDYLVPR